MKYLLLLIPSLCFAQTPIDSIWYLGQQSTVRTITVTPISGTTSVTALQQGVGFSALQTTITITFPPSATPYIFSGVRLTVSAKGGGYIEEQPWIGRIPQTDVPVAAGQTATITYFAPTTGPGSVGPVALGPLPPPPPPPPAPVTSPDGTKMPPSDSITYPVGVLWTKGSPSADGTAGQISVFRNGAQVKGSVTYVILKDGQIFNCDPLPPTGSGSGYERWNGSGWTLISSTCP
jgi:hypothetical protein